MFRYPRSQRKVPAIVQLRRVRDELKSDPVLKRSLDALKAWRGSPPLTVLCLGLGSPVSSVNARAQLALLLELGITLNIDCARVALYDPVFTDEDRSMFAELTLKVLSQSEAEEYVADGPTMLFMPHCDLDLYETVLKAHWDPEKLFQLVFFCNRFADYIENNPRHKLELRAPTLLKTVPFLISHDLPSSDCYPNAFNNTSIQFLAEKPPVT